MRLIVLSVLEYLDINAPLSTCLGVIMAKTALSGLEKCNLRTDFSSSVKLSRKLSLFLEVITKEPYNYYKKLLKIY
jgi:hypothetical protein